MSLFISTENQQLLYGMIHKTPEINVFSNTEEKNQWFRSIIERFARQLPATITRDKLKEVNREVLGFMINSLRSQKPVVRSPQIPEQRLLKREQPLEPREYTTFYDLPKPKVIDFSEKIEDPVITNMEELIEQQKRMRERELQEYAPPPLVPNAPIPRAQENVRMKILEELPKTVLDNLSEMEPLPLASSMRKGLEKHVQFEEPFMTRLLESLDRLNTRMDQIEKKVDQLIPAKVSDPVSIIKDLISREIEEPSTS